MKNQKGIDLTEGVIWKQILLFAWPILISNIFQQIYNLTNSFIVGRYVGTTALSAVSATQSIIYIYGYLFYGIGMGSGIIVAKYYGAKQHEEVKRTIETSIIFTVAFGLVITLASELLIPFFLNISHVSAEIYDQAQAYLRIYFLSNLAILIYNSAFFISRSLGDSKRTLRYLVVSCLTNLVLGIIFVRIFHLGVIGVGCATVISQTVVAILSFTFLVNIADINLKSLHFDGQLCRKILTLGIPAGIQNMLIALSMFFIQSYVNQFPTEAIAGIGVAEKVATWAQIPMQAINGVITSFVGQNIGAGKYERIHKGIRFSNFAASICTFVLAIILFWKAEFFVSLFNDNPGVVFYGAQSVRFTVFAYIPIGWSHIYNGACRGAENVRVPLIIAVTSQVIFRALFAYVGLKIWHDIHIIYLSGALCFTLAGILATLYYNFSSWTKEHGLR